MRFIHDRPKQMSGLRPNGYPLFRDRGILIDSSFLEAILLPPYLSLAGGTVDRASRQHDLRVQNRIVYDPGNQKWPPRRGSG